MKDAARLDKPSASSFEITAMCPGSPALLASLPDQPEEPDETALLGTKLHKAWETDDTEGLDEEDLELYRRGVALRQSAVQDWSAQWVVPTFRECPRELRLWLHDEGTLEPVASGQLDSHFLSADGQFLLIVDYKSLWCRTLPPAYRSWQLRLQALLAWKEYETPSVVRVAFLKAMMDKCDYTDFRVNDLENAEQAVRFRLWQASNPNAQRVPGLHCNWCKAKAWCREAASFALLPSVGNGGALIQDEGQILGMVEAMSGEELRLVWERSGVIGKVLAAVLRRLKTMTDEQLRALGIGRVPGRRLDPVLDTRGLWNFLRQDGISEEELWSALKWSKTELQKAVQRDKGWKADAAKGYLKEALEPFIEKKQAEPSLERIEQ